MAVGSHGGAAGNSVGETHGHAAAQHAHEDSYGASAQVNPCSRKLWFLTGLNC